MLRPAAKLLVMTVGSLWLGASQVVPMIAHQKPGHPAPAVPFAGLISVQSFDVVPEGDRLHALVSGQFAQDEPRKLAYLESTDGVKAGRRRNSSIRGRKPSSPAGAMMSVWPFSASGGWPSFRSRVSSLATAP